AQASSKAVPSPTGRNRRSMARGIMMRSPARKGLSALTRVPSSAEPPGVREGRAEYTRSPPTPGVPRPPCRRPASSGRGGRRGGGGGGGGGGGPRADKREPLSLPRGGGARHGAADHAEDQRRRLGDGRELPHRAVVAGPANAGRAEEVAVGVEGYAARRT